MAWCAWVLRRSSSSGRPRRCRQRVSIMPPVRRRRRAPRRRRFPSAAAAGCRRSATKPSVSQGFRASSVRSRDYLHILQTTCPCLPNIVGVTSRRFKLKFRVKILIIAAARVGARRLLARLTDSENPTPFGRSPRIGRRHFSRRRWPLVRAKHEPRQNRLSSRQLGDHGRPGPPRQSIINRTPRQLPTGLGTGATGG